MQRQRLETVGSSVFFMPKTIFQAEILEVKTRKTMSMDKVITIKLETTDEQALELQRYIAEKTITVEIEE